MNYGTFFKYLDENKLENAMEYKNSFIPNRLYNFRALYKDNKKANKEKLNALAESKIWLSSLDSFNDPFEYENFYIDIGFKDRYPHIYEITTKVITILKKRLFAACLTDNINNLPLGAHYANNHQGFCIEYILGSSDKICFENNMQYVFQNDKDSIFPISYENKRVNACNIALYYMNSILKERQNPIIEDKRSQLSHAMELYLLGTLKHERWRYENEYRLLWFNQKEEENGLLFFMNPSSIYIGLNCCNEHKTELISIAKQINCSVFEVYIDKYTVDYNLAYHQIL